MKKAHEPPTGEAWTNLSKSLGYCSVTLVEFGNVRGMEPGGHHEGRLMYVGHAPDSSQADGPVQQAVVPGLVFNSELGPARAMSVLQGGGALRPGILMEPRGRPDLTLPSRVSIVTLPGEISPEHEIENRLVVLIDTLRMSSTLVTAMGQGLESAQLFSSVMEVVAAFNDYGSCALLGGEQSRVLIPGFDRDNSPRSYLEGVEDKTALFLTTNGTRALPWIRDSKLLILGSFLNASAVIRIILAHLKDVSGVVFVCSGTGRGTVRSEDDELCAGYLLKTLLASHRNAPALLLDEQAVDVLQRMYPLDTWEAVCAAFSVMPAADELRQMGMEGDIEFCLQRDRYSDMLPFYCQCLDLFFSHTVRYDTPVRFEVFTKRRLMGGLGLHVGVRPGGSEPLQDGGAGVIQVYLVWQDEEDDVFETGSPPGDFGEVEAARRHRDLVDGFTWLDLGVVACSNAHCCRVTAERIAKGRLCPEIYSGLSPVRGGDWADLDAAEIEQHYPGRLQRWQEDPAWRDHGGESFGEVHSRATSTFTALLRSFVDRGCTGSMVVVTHGALVRSILMAAERVPLEQAASVWRRDPLQRDSIILVDVSVPQLAPGTAKNAPHRIPDLCSFHVSTIGRGAIPIALSSRGSRL